MEESNIPQSVKDKFNRKLHLEQHHPLKIIKDVIYNYFHTTLSGEIKTFDELPNIVSTTDNFDLLLIPKNHPSRSRSDTYYVLPENINTTCFMNDEYVLRTHTSAHQNKLISDGHRCFLVSGDVYRKDEIDRFHYPIFHQMEGVNINFDTIEDAEVDLKNVLGGLVEYLFPDKEYRFNKDYFPFTEPSFEVEVKFFDKWVEILGCGVIHRDILKHNNVEKFGWAFGLGLERLAMILFSIPDIRLFWTCDRKFLDQFNEIVNYKTLQFKPYSTLNNIDRDISFWLDNKQVKLTDDSFEWTNINDFFEVVREVSGDDIELVTLYDKFFHKKTQKYSHTFRLTYSATADSKMIDPGEFTKKCNNHMEMLRQIVQTNLKIELR
jgi:phenylalanyl-tRNA synthetase alpha chain